ncbi:hypothetical protein TNCV_316841 [Trichonephila clavipes]|nr:hypothetical protein TNCV_316841 [Trichonephila clavipes]
MIVHDEVPMHFCAPVRDWLDMAYLGRWIILKTCGFIAATFTSLIHWIFYIWGILKELLYRDLITAQRDFIDRLVRHVPVGALFLRYLRDLFL